MVGWLMKDELKRVWKEADVENFKVVSWDSPVRTSENHENPQYGRSASRLRINF
jgi:hypothetical protein